MAYFIDPNAYVIERVEESGIQGPDGPVPTYEVDGAKLYSAYLNKLTETGDVATVTRPGNEREQRYLRQLQGVGQSTVSLTKNAEVATGSEQEQKGRDLVLETIRKWATWTLSDMEDAPVVGLRIKNVDGSADRYRLWT